MNANLVITAIGPDRPGIVSLISDVGQRFAANWEESRMASLAGQFAGMVHFEVAEDKAEALEAALRELEAQGLRIVVARSAAGSVPAGARNVRLELVGHDRPGIVRDLSQALASRAVSIAEIETEVADAAMAGGHLFKVRALLLVPPSVSNEQLREGLEALANEMMVDIEVD
jgi:glycine cleavage system regulatory protein